MADIGIQNLLDIIAQSGKNYDLAKIQLAYEYASEMHAGQYRKSGEAYIIHPISVAEIVAGLGLDTESICAAFLHDTLEDCSDKVDVAEMRKDFGGDVLEIVMLIPASAPVSLTAKESSGVGRSPLKI